MSLRQVKSNQTHLMGTGISVAVCLESPSTVRNVQNRGTVGTIKASRGLLVRSPCDVFALVPWLGALHAWQESCPFLRTFASRGWTSYAQVGGVSSRRDPRRPGLR